MKSVLFSLFLLSFATDVAADEKTQITSEPPMVRVSVKTNAWVDELIKKQEEGLRKQSASGQSFENMRLIHEKLKHENPSVIVSCITPCELDFTDEIWRKSELTTDKKGFPIFRNDLRRYFDLDELLPPSEIHVKLKMPKTIPGSCLFDEGFVFSGSQAAQPCFRPNGKAPKSFRKNEFSYKCLVQFDLDKLGKTQNVQVSNCPKKLQKTANKTIQSWRYVPEIIDGRAVEVKAVKTNILYVYTDTEGRKYPFKG